MAFDYNKNFGTFVRKKYAYPIEDFELNPDFLNFGLEYDINVAAIWIGNSPTQYAFCDLTTDTSLTLSHSAGSLTSFTLNANTVNVNSPIKISLNSVLVECSTEIKAPLGTFASLTAPYKMFDIKHPSKENKRLRHACLEGPEISVFIKGKLQNQNTINLPDYWINLVDPESIIVSLTQIGESQDLIVEHISLESIKIKSNLNAIINCHYTIMATRKDVQPLEIEVDEYTS
jgi:hypothetical protein